MHLNDTGPGCVVWLNKNGLMKGSHLAHAFFALRVEALAFVSNTGGELYLKHPDGSLKRNG